MAQKQVLHELLKEDQEPFQLSSYVAERRSQLNKSSPITASRVKDRNTIVSAQKGSNNLCKNACFFSFQKSPDVRKSPLIDFQSPGMSPCKSPRGAVFLHVPSRTAALLVEAAMRIQKQANPKSQIKNFGFGLFGSVLKILKDRSKKKKEKKRAIGDNELIVTRIRETEENEALEEKHTISCSCNNNSISCRTEELNDMINGDFAFLETRFCSSPVSPFRFSLSMSPSSTGCRTPELCSPAASPIRRVNEEKQNYATGEDSENVQGVEEEEKEQCSPVSVLDPFLEDDGHESIDDEEEDYDLDSTYANVERARQQLLERLRRFEKLAELDPIELEKKLLESSDNDDEYQTDIIESQGNGPLSLYENLYSHTFVDQVFSIPKFRHSSKGMSSDLKRLKIKERGKIICLGRQIFNRSQMESWKQKDFDTIDKVVELDLKRDFNESEKFPEQVEETATEVEVAIFGQLVEELSNELFYLNRHSLDS